MPRESPPHPNRLGLLSVLVAAAVFLVSLFLPFAGGAAGSSSIFSSFSASPIPDRLGDFLYLFGGVAIIALVALKGLTREGSRSWAPKAIPIVVAAWSLPWIGFVDNATGRSVHAFHPGSWVLSGSLLTAIAGAIGAAFSARRSDSQMELPRVALLGLRSRYGYVAVLVASGAFVVSLTLPIVRLGAGPYSLSVSGTSLWGVYRHVAAFTTFLGGLIVIAATAIVGIRAGAARDWIPYALIGSVAVWSFFWIALLLSLILGFSVEVGCWALVLCIVVTVSGALEAFVAARAVSARHT